MNLRTESRGDTLLVTGMDRLTATNAQHFKELTHAQLTDAHRFVEVDLSLASMLDSVGLGALVSVQKRLAGRQGGVRLLRPVPFVHRMLLLLAMDQVFEIVTA